MRYPLVVLGQNHVLARLDNNRTVRQDNLNIMVLRPANRLTPGEGCFASLFCNSDLVIKWSKNANIRGYCM